MFTLRNKHSSLNLNMLTFKLYFYSNENAFTKKSLFMAKQKPINRYFSHRMLYIETI